MRTTLARLMGGSGKTRAEKALAATHSGTRSRTTSIAVKAEATRPCGAIERAFSEGSVMIW